MWQQNESVFVKRNRETRLEYMQRREQHVPWKLFRRRFPIWCAGVQL